MQDEAARAAAEAGIQAATISVWGAVAVGVIATIGTVASGLLGPFLIRRSEQKYADQRDRMTELRTIVPTLVRVGIEVGLALDIEVRRQVLPEVSSSIARLALWAGPEEWQIPRIANVAFMYVPDDVALRMRSRLAAAELLPRWAVGDITALEAQRRFEKDTGTTLARWSPAGDGNWDPSVARPV